MWSYQGTEIAKTTVVIGSLLQKSCGKMTLVYGTRVS